MNAKFLISLSFSTAACTITVDYFTSIVLIIFLRMFITVYEGQICGKLCSL